MVNSVCFRRVVTPEDAFVSSRITQQKEEHVGPLILALLHTLAAEKSLHSMNHLLVVDCVINNVCVHPQPKCFRSFSRRFIVLLNWPLVCVCVCVRLCVYMFCVHPPGCAVAKSMLMAWNRWRSCSLIYKCGCKQVGDEQTAAFFLLLYQLVRSPHTSRHQNVYLLDFIDCQHAACAWLKV